MQRLKHIWEYIVHHKWSKDILRANLLYIVLVLLYELCHFGLKPVSLGAGIKMWLLMNLCLFFKLVLDIIDRLIKLRARGEPRGH
ncbi:hypothetical protein KZE55_08860 [Limosilactobacillus panis]|uniref:hypothetical protein n=1 Tax=Limosilactobacillus TaxID=2742598 RepID=UPI001C96F511|nr:MULTISPECIES: hypothetical protein [Limosilactobacillus]QZN92855.1 hypothetical protein KZE55_08860 [Limosilactobacillus panis]